MYIQATFGPNAPATLGALTQPSLTILYGDAGLPNFPVAGITGETIQIDPPADWFGYPSEDFRHQGFADFAFCDGHVKAIKREAFTAALPAAQQNAASGITTYGDLWMERQ